MSGKLDERFINASQTPQANTIPVSDENSSLKDWIADNELLEKIKNVNGENSGLDADLLDGQHGSFYTNANNLNAGTVPVERLSGTYNIDISGNAATATNADKLDNLDSSNFVKFNDLTVIKLTSNGNSIVWEKIGELRGVNGVTGAELSFIVYGSGDYGQRGRQTLFVNAQQRGDNGVQVDVYSLENGNVASRKITVGYIQVGTYNFDIYIKRDYYNPCVVVGSNSTFNGTIIKNPTTLSSEPSGIVYVNTNKIWHAGDDGSGSGLDADTLDGQHGSYYRNASNLNAGTVPAARLSGTYNISISGNAATATNADKVDNFHASHTPHANTIPVANSSGKLDSGWLPSTVGNWQQNFNQNGYTKLPNGLIIQWGNSSVGGNSAKTVYFPISFPNACRSIVSIPIGGSSGGGSEDFWGVYNVSKSRFTQSNQYDGGHNFYWIAIGY